ncbi:stimulator of interferon genes protein homolog [Drosophila sulfurigaster albostrigata]|uniref:stimulator of interferon genes protein homolog n=1 Tax=Drosophila sulfurigaster albostrigata TaxID=89887 RepID=UPI002D21C4B5|nr:stimulator of interferon genes protein homolog [Drosophila sulfurigaster albostrigata]
MAIISTTTADQWVDRKKSILKMVGEYFDLCIRICLVVFCANFVGRLCNMIIEYFVNEKYYLPENKLSTICERVYTYNTKTKILALTLALSGFARFGFTGNVANLLPNSVYFACMPLYWIFTWSQVTHSPLDYAQWIREPHGLDYAAGMASNYFHGYLKIALPEHNGDGLKKRMQIYEDTHQVTFGINRLIILIPDNMFVKGVIESPLLEQVAPLETRFINRAGVNRPFKHAVYRLTQSINGKIYYFAIEGATPMLSFFDAMNSQTSTTKQMREMKREIWLKFAKHLRELVKGWPETEDEVEMIVYDSRKDVGKVIHAHFLNKSSLI